MLASEVGCKALHEQCAREFSTENMDCWEAIRDYLSKPLEFKAMEVSQSRRQ